MKELAAKYEKAVVEEDKLTPEKLAVANVGRQARNARRQQPRTFGRRKVGARQC